mgnify:CR=1 FL=1
MYELKQKIALFIDADNAPASKFEDVLSEVANYGVVTIRKAYGNWKSPTLKAWEDLLHEYAIQPIQQYDLTKGKNASDIALVIDAMDVMYTKQIDVMCFVSSDCDFTPMVTRALAEGKVVLGFGERKTPAAFVNACSKFLFLDEEKEKTKISVRNIRRESNESARKQKADGIIAEDRMKKLEKEIQELTDKACKEADEIADKKEKEISTI